MTEYLFTSESVSEGHPDKMADQISDAVVDAILAQDPHARIACESLVKTGIAMLAGEVTTTATVDFEELVREVSMIKAFCGELVNEVMYACVQFHGGMGFMRESAIERMSRDARVQAIGGGATEVMLEEVAKRM